MSPGLRCGFRIIALVREAPNDYDLRVCCNPRTPHCAAFHKNQQCCLRDSCIKNPHFTRPARLRGSVEAYIIEQSLVECGRILHGSTATTLFSHENLRWSQRSSRHVQNYREQVSVVPGYLSANDAVNAFGSFCKVDLLWKISSTRTKD